MSLKLDLCDGLPPVVLVRRQRKHVCIRVHAHQIEVAAAPNVPLALLQQILDERRDWLARHWRRQTERAREQASLPTRLSIAGHEHRLFFEPGTPSPLRHAASALHGTGSVLSVKAQVAGYLQQCAQALFAQRLQHYAAFAVRPPQRLCLSSAKTRWGSCHKNGTIRLNWRLVQAPLAILDYVIAHELAHLRHMNHSAAFWQETARLYPEWQSARLWLRQHGQSLFNFG